MLSLISGPREQRRRLHHEGEMEGKRCGARAALSLLFLPRSSGAAGSGAAPAGGSRAAPRSLRAPIGVLTPFPGVKGGPGAGWAAGPAAARRAVGFELRRGSSFVRMGRECLLHLSPSSERSWDVSECLNKV